MIMKEGVVSIDPQKRDEYRELVERKLRAHYEDKWAIAFPSYEYYRENISNASFLAYLLYFLEETGENGQIDIPKMEMILREKLGEYYSQEKFENTVIFFEDEGWIDL